MAFATKEYVDRVEGHLRMRERTIREDLGAIGDTVVELLEGQQRLDAKVTGLDTRLRQTDANVRAIMSHLGVPETDGPGPDGA